MTHPPKERPLRVGPFEAKNLAPYGMEKLWFVKRTEDDEDSMCVKLADLPALARLVAKMQAAESRRGKVRR